MKVTREVVTLWVFGIFGGAVWALTDHVGGSTWIITAAYYLSWFGLLLWQVFGKEIPCG